MAEFPLTLTFESAYEHDKYVREYAGDYLDVQDVFPFAYDGWYDETGMDEDQAIEYAEEMGYMIPDPKDTAEIHDAWHTGAIRWCEIGQCVYVY
jgi:hypothetical protein